MAITALYLRPRPQRWWQVWWAGLLRDLFQRYVLFLLLGLFCRPLRVEGTEHLAGVWGPVVLVANHSSHFDTLLVLRSIPPHLRRRLTVAAAADYFYGNPLKGATVSLLLNTFPFNRNGNARLGLRRCADLIRGGWSLLIYPEGTRSVDGSIQSFKGGVGLLATKLGVPVVPIYLEGAHELMPKGSWRPRRRPVTVRIGEAVAPPSHTDAMAVVSDLQERVRDLGRSQHSGRPCRHTMQT